MKTLTLILIFGCFSAGNCLVLKEKTPNLVKIREGDTLTLEAEVDSHELNLRFTGPGYKSIGYGYNDHRATDGYEVLNWTDTGYLFSVWLTIEHVDRFQSGRYFLTGFDAYSWEQCNWTVVVQVMPLRHLSVTPLPTCYVSEDGGEPRCGRYTAGHDNYWEYMGCNVTVRGAGDIIVSQFDQCEGLHEADDEDKTDLLYEATKHGDEQQASMLIMLGANVNGRNGYESPLCISARLGHTQIVRLLLNSGASVYVSHTFLLRKTLFSRSYYLYARAVHCAAWSGSVALVEMLLAREADSRTKNVRVEREVDFPFHFAAMSGSLSLVKKGLSWGENWNQKDSVGRTPIFYAALSGSIQLVQFLKNLGADLLTKDSYGDSLLFNAARSGSLDLVEYLVSAGLNPLEKNFQKETPMVEAVLGGSVPVLEAFIKWGGAATYIDGVGESLLHYAAIMGHAAMVKKLVAVGLNINATAISYHWTPLHYAAEYGHPSLVRTIISLGGDIEARDQHGATPLYMAATYLNPMCVEVLLGANANVSAANRNGETPLHLSRRVDPLSIIRNVRNEGMRYKTWRSRRGEVIALLLKAGGNASSANSRGETPLHSIAGSLDNQFVPACKKEYILLLVKAGGDPNAADRDGKTPLHCAANARALSCARALVETGASPAAVKEDGETPLDVAKRSVYREDVAEWTKLLKT